MYDFLKNESFLKAKLNKQHFFFENALSTSITWNDVFLNLEKSLEDNSKIIIRPNFGFITLTGEKYLTEVNSFLQEIVKSHINNLGSAHVYVALTKHTQSFGKHQDKSDVFFWQIIGKTHWKVFHDDTISEYVLDVGDIIYIPASMPHDVTSLGPRVGISFGLDY